MTTHEIGGPSGPRPVPPPARTAQPPGPVEPEQPENALAGDQTSVEGDLRSVLDELGLQKPDDIYELPGELVAIERPLVDVLAPVPGQPGTYTYDRGGVRIWIDLDDAAALQPQLKQLARLLDRLPHELLRVNREIKLWSGPSPDEPYWRQKFEDPDFVVAATGGGGTINFYRGMVDEGTLVHEAAHNFASYHFGNVDPRRTSTGHVSGQDWDDAIAADGNFPSAYGETVRQKADSDGEDFAEATRIWMQAKAAGPLAVMKFQAMYPHRAAILEQLFGAT